jgi:SPFH domain / Band 7 family
MYMYWDTDNNNGVSPGKPRMSSCDRIVPERTAFVIERFGKYAKTLQPGLHLLIPIVSLTTHR